MSISIHLLERSNYSSFDIESILGKATYTLYPEEDIGVYIKKKVKTAFFIYTDANILLPVENILKTVALLQSKDKSFVYPLNELLEINNSQYSTLKDTLDIEHWKRKNVVSNSTEKRMEFVEAYAVSKRYFIKAGGNNLHWSFFQEDGFNLEKQIRYRFLGFNIRKVNHPAYRLFNKDEVLKLEKNNSIDQYLSVYEGNIEDVKRKLAYGKFSFNKSYLKRKEVTDSKIGLASLKSESNLGELKNDFCSDYINFCMLTCNNQINIQDKLYDITIKALRNKLDYIILLTEEIDINQDLNVFNFFRAIEKMSFYGLQVLSTIATGAITDVDALGVNILTISGLPACSVYVIDKSLFNKILETTLGQIDSIEIYLNYLTKHVGIFVPFIGKPKALRLNDEKYLIGYKDRISYINSLEDRLIWISTNYVTLKKTYNILDK